MAQSTSSTGNQPLIELKHVDKHYGDLHVLNDINLSVDRGEVVVVIGPSGSGKSTMCRTINRLETIDSGEILIEGQPLPQEGKDLARMRAELGMVFQQFNLFAHMTVLQNVMLGPVDVLGVSKDEARERAMDLLGRVGVAEQADKVPAQLSGGQQQRVAIARSLAMQPKAMLFDEPTSALDPEMINEVLRAKKPLFTTCRGTQLLNVATGGTLCMDVPSLGAREGRTQWRHTHVLNDPVHPVEVVPGSLLERAVGGHRLIQTNSAHHCCVDRLGKSTRLVAKATDGVPECIEVEGQPFCLGVQWHPEYTWQTLETDFNLWKSFVEAAAKVKQAR